jgi:hypothetical protein
VLIVFSSFFSGKKSTMILYSVIINNTLVDRSQSLYDYQAVLNILSTRRQICQNSYPYSYQFQLINEEKICASRIV